MTNHCLPVAKPNQVRIVGSQIHVAIIITWIGVHIAHLTCAYLHGNITRDEGNAIS